MARKEIQITYDSPFATNLRMLLDKKGETQIKLAHAIGTTPQAVSTYRNGTAVPNILVIEKIADYFGVTVDWLLKGENSAVTESQKLAEAASFLGLSIGSIETLRNLSKHKQNEPYKRIAEMLLEEEDHFGKMLMQLANAKLVQDQQPPTGFFKEERNHIRPDGMVTLIGTDAQQFFIQLAINELRSFANEYIAVTNK